MTLTVSPKLLARRLALVVLLLCVASVASQAVRVLTRSPHVHELTNIFKVDRESTIPTYFSALMLLACGAVFALIGRRERGRRYAGHWRGLAIIFACLSVDEAVGIHELTMNPTRELLGADGFLLFTWVVPYAVLLAAFVALYWRFWRQLPARLRRMMALAGLLYVGSAVGIEMVGARLYDEFGRMDVRYALVALAEEAGEMLALVLLLGALLRHLAGGSRSLQLHISAADAPAPHERQQAADGIIPSQARSAQRDPAAGELPASTPRA